MTLSKTVKIFDIKRYSIKDGPGIRITLFFKGCPLSCVWCHNPEGISTTAQRMYTANRCIGCNSCVEACHNSVISVDVDRLVFDSTLCVSCGDCATACPSKAIEMAGRDYTINELLTIIEKETIFFDNSGSGGVTFCGGEPFLHATELVELLKECKNRVINTVIDTTLFTTKSNIDATLPYTDLYLIDLKMMDSVKHKFYTGVDNKIILENIEYLAQKGGKFWIRIPLIDGVNCDDNNIHSSAKFLATLGSGCRKIELLPYHDIAKSKHARLATIYNPANIDISTPNNESIERIISIFQSYGLEAKV